MIIRIALYIGLIVVFTTGPLPIAVVCALAYAFRYTAYELLALAFVLDGFYGVQFAFSIPFYTLGALVALVIVEWLKPLISVYNQ